jgi:hypothetical protein
MLLDSWKQFVMHKWLARLSYSFFIVAAVLLWEASKLGPGERWRLTVYVLGAVVCIALCAAGIRARHRDVD